MLNVQNSEMGVREGISFETAYAQKNAASRCNLLHGVTTRYALLQYVTGGDVQ